METKHKKCEKPNIVDIIILHKLLFGNNLRRIII
jgi:hypothetical protein